MSMVLWVNYLKDGHVTSDEYDLRALYDYTRKLDKICRQIHARKLSDFHDLTEVEANLSSAAHSGVNNWQLMAAKGKWFDPAEGIAVLTPLLARLVSKPERFGFFSNDSALVVEELEHCKKAIVYAAESSAKFHLGVVT